MGPTIQYKRTHQRQQVNQHRYTRIKIDQIRCSDLRIEGEISVTLPEPARVGRGQRLHLVIGMLEAKDPAALIGPLAHNCASITAVPVPDHDFHYVAAFGPDATWADSVPEALARIRKGGLPVLVAGSLYLAGDVLRLSGALPD